MKRDTLEHWDKAFDPTSCRDFTMPLMPMSMRKPELR